MDKKLAFFFQLEDQVDKIINLILKLKEENEQLRSDNDNLKKRNSEKLISNENQLTTDMLNNEMREPLAEDIQKRVKNALMQLDQLKNIINNEG